MINLFLLACGILLGLVVGAVGGFVFTSLVFFSDFDDYLKWVEVQARSGRRDLRKPYTRPRKMPWDN